MIRYPGLLATLALAGCATLQPTRSAPIVGPMFGCQAEAWRDLVRTVDTSDPAAWWRVTEAAKFAPQTGVCCLLPDDTFSFCPTGSGLDYVALDAYQKAQKKAEQEAQPKPAPQEKVGQPPVKLPEVQ